MDYQTMYAQKLRTAEDAVKIVKDGDWVDYSQTCSFPQALDAALADQRAKLEREPRVLVMPHGGSTLPLMRV